MARLSLIILKPVFLNDNFFARREAKTETRHRDWSAKKASLTNHVAEFVVNQSRCRISRKRA